MFEGYNGHFKSWGRGDLKSQPSLPPKAILYEGLWQGKSVEVMMMPYCK